MTVLLLNIHVTVGWYERSRCWSSALDCICHRMLTYWNFNKEDFC